MKTLNYILYGFAVLLLTSCNSNDLGVKYTLCKDKTVSRGLPGEDESYLTYKVDGTTLKVEIYNYFASCGTEKVTIESECNEDNQITVKLTEIGLSANCICPMDVSFPLTNLQKGETYECVIKAKEPSMSFHTPRITFSFTMEKGANGKILF